MSVPPPMRLTAALMWLGTPLASELAAQPRPVQTKVMAHHVDRSTDGDGRLIAVMPPK